MKLLDHINTNHDGKRYLFADSMGVDPAQVTRWIKSGCEVRDGQLWRPIRDIKSKDKE